MIQELEKLVRSGRLSEARKNLRELNLKRVPRPEWLAFANLARRLDLGKLSLRILNPIVRPTGRSRATLVPASIPELVEYAACLRVQGAVVEALEILSEIDGSRHPQALFQKALCQFSRWQYGTAIPLLRAYIASFGAPSYSMRVGQVNLLQALVHEELFEEARTLVAELLDQVDPSELPFLHQRALELAAQYEIFASGDLDQAVRYLERARGYLPHGQATVHELLILKWVAIARSLQSRRPVPELREAASRASALGAGEIVRDCEYYQAALTGDEAALVKLYFGTPFESYRMRIRKSLPAGALLPDAFVWSMAEGSAPKRVLDLQDARVGGQDSGLTPGQELHRLLITLSQDFYQPAPLLSIFSRLFPAEYFHPDSSPTRVHQLIYRFRRWADSHDLPLRIEEKGGNYRLLIAGPLGISVPRQPLPLDPRELELLNLRARIAHGAFSSAEALSVLGTSKSTVGLLLCWAVGAGKLQREGRTNRVVYRWVA